MKKILFAVSAVALALSAGSAMAADLPSYKAPPVYIPPPPMWTGFYAGLNAGYGWGTSLTPPLPVCPFLILLTPLVMLMGAPSDLRP